MAETPGWGESFVSRYAAWARKHTSAPVGYHRAVAFGCLATAAGRKLWIPYAGKRLFPNLWLLLIGDSGLAKTTCLDLGVKIMRGLEPSPFFPGDFSMQKLYDVMKAKPQGVMVHREFRVLHDILRRDYMSGTKALLTDIYDCPPWIEYETKGASVRVEDPCLNIQAASTPEWLAGKDIQADIGGGWLARFLIVPYGMDDGAKSSAWPAGDDLWIGEREDLKRELALIGQVGGCVRFDTAARQCYSDYFEDFCERSALRHGRLAPFFARARILPLKLAMLLHVASGHDTAALVASETVEEAILYTDDWTDRFVRFMEGDRFAMTRHQDMENAVLRSIPANAPVAQRDLYRRTGFSKRELASVLETLSESGRIVCEHHRNPHGPPTVLWFKPLKPTGYNVNGQKAE